MKSLLIEKTTIGTMETEVIMLYDLGNKKSSYVYTNEVNYQEWVINKANAFRDNGYLIFNNTNIKLKTKKELKQPQSIIEAADIALKYFESVSPKNNLK